MPPEYLHLFILGHHFIKGFLYILFHLYQIRQNTYEMTKMIFTFSKNATIFYIRCEHNYTDYTFIRNYLHFLS